MRGLVLALAAALSFSTVGQAVARESAVAALRARQHSIDAALDALDKDPGDSAKKAALDHVVRETFDFEKLGRVSIGSHWGEMTQAQQKEYLRLFKSLLLKSTIRKLKTYRALETKYAESDTDSTNAVVTTVVKPTDGDPVAIQYKLDLKEGRWWVWDTTVGLDTVITEYDVSTADNYRSAFNKIVADDGVAGLINKLREKESSDSDF